MPLYEYQCEHCGERFEKIQKFSDPPLETCPKCGAGPVHKLVAAPAFQFKGTGWYVTDYARKDASGAGSKKESAPKDAGGDKSGADAGSKEAAKTEETKPKGDTAKAEGPSSPSNPPGSTTKNG